jgi:PAS domain S-box-containing protein
MRALYVATDLRDADVLQQEVRRAAPKLTFDVCSGTVEARSRVEGSLTYDAMILDSSLPEHEQQQLIEHVRSRQIPLPIVILVGQGATPSSALVASADECITRGPRLAERLAPGLRMAIERYRVVATMTRENERLKRSEARLRLIIEAMPAGVVLVDQAGKIQAMNLAGAALVGSGGPSDVVGRELYSLADHDGIQALRELFARAFDGTRGKATFTCHSPNGELRPLQIDALCIQKDAQGQGSVLGVLSPATGVAVVEPPAPVEEESGVDFAFANDPHSEERMALEQAIEELRGEVLRLQHEAEGERARVQQVLEELERSRATAAEHHAQKAQIEERCLAAEAKVEALETQRREQDGSASALQARAEQLAGETDGLRGDRERLQRELDDIRTERQLLQARVDAIASDRQTVQGELDAVRREREALQQEIARLAADAAASQSGAQTRVAELDAALREAHAKSEATEKALKADLDKLRADAVRVAEALAAEGKTRQGAEAALAAARDTLQAKVHELESQAGELESKRQAAVARIAELEEGRRAEQAALAAAKKQESELEHQLKAARDEAARAAHERDGLKAELGRLHESHRAAEDDASLKASEGARLRSELEARVATLQAAIDQAGGERQAAHADLDHARAQIDHARAEADHARSEADQARQERDVHARELEELRQEREALRRDAEALRQEGESLRRDAEALQRDAETLRREIAAGGQRATDLTQVLERERAEARQRTAAMEREHQDAIARLHKQIEETREFQAAASARAVPERGRRRPGERLGQLASAMANDLHGIVNGMADEARRLLADLPEGSDVRAQAEQSLQSANRAGQLVRHLLRLSEREARATSGSDPNGIVRANEPMLRQLAGPDIDLRFELAASLPSVECDADELTGVLSTLMVTVRGALPLGGSIRVTTAPPRKDGGRRRNDSSLTLSLIAEGYGMVPVPTTVCDEVVTRSGGTFGAQVDLKGGTTTFTAYLPIDQSADQGVTNIA